MDYAIDNITVTVEKNADAGRDRLLAYNMANATMKEDKKEDKENA